MEYITRQALLPHAALPSHDKAAMSILRERMDAYEDADLRSHTIPSG
jgi:hypothetical protein